MLSLDEAIAHYLKIAEENEKDAEQFKRIKATQDMISHCYECAKEHRQLADWLRELKAYDEARAEIIRKSKSGQWSEGGMFGINFALGIIDKHIKGITENEEVTADE